MNQLPFTKLHGLGNDYVLINALDSAIDDPAALACRITDRRMGVGADGIILVLGPEQDVQADLRMRMFNSDGSEAEMCGNGIRCLCKYAWDHGLCRADPMRIQTAAGVLPLVHREGPDGRVREVEVDMGEPVLDAARIPVQLPQPYDGPLVNVPLERYIPLSSLTDWMEESRLDPRMTCLSMGNPHLVLFCGHASAVPLETIGPFLEHQPIFPERVNVHFVEARAPIDVAMRTWERGSGATLACGTGAAAVCVAGVLTERTDRQILAHLPGGDLHLRWDQASNHVFMTGPATEVFTGSWPL